MVKGPSTWKILSALAALIAAFWAGRTSSPVDVSTEEEPILRPTRSAARSASRQRPAQSGPGAGSAAITSALDLRDLFKRSGGNMEVGKTMAAATLARMNGEELTRLVHDLAAAQASSPGYSFTLEINTACTRWAEIDPDAALDFALSNKQGSFRSAAIGSIFAGIAKTDPDLARSKLAYIDDPMLRTTARSSILSALATDRPDDWVAAVKADPSSLNQYNIGSIASEWAMDDPAAAADRLKLLPVAIQSNAAASIAKIWAGKDPQAAMSWAQSLTDPRQQRAALAAVTGGMAAKDPDAALAMLESLDPATRRAGISSVFETLVDLDFDSALAKASALSDPSDQKTAISQLLGNTDYYSNPFSRMAYSSRSTEQLTAIIAMLPPGQLRDQGIGKLGNQLAASSAGELTRLLEIYPPGDRQKIQSSLIQSLSYSNPVRAMEIYQSMPRGGTDSYTGQNIISYLARQDPEAALNYALEAKTRDERVQGAMHAFTQMATNDPAAATRRLDSLPDGPVRESAVNAISSAWAAVDPEAARSWAEGLADGEKNKALTALIPSLANHDPKAAAGILDKLMSSSPDNNSLLHTATNFVQIWSTEDPVSAGTWSLSLPDGYTKNQAIRSLTGTWAQHDPDAAAEWLNTLPDGDARDSGIQSMVNQSLRSDPATAFTWATSTQGDQQRANLMESVVRQWKESDPDKARAAVNRADLSDTERERLLRSFE